MDASEIYAKRLNAKEVIFPRKIHFPSRRWTNKIRWRRSGTENTHLDTGTSNSRRRLRRFSWRMRRFFFTTLGLVSGCQWSTKWLLVHVRKTSCTAMTLNPESNLARREMNHSLFHWNTLTSPELHIQTWMLSKRSRIDDYWNIDGARDLSDPWAGFTQFATLSEKPPEGHMWSGERLRKRQATSRPDHLWPDLWRGMSKNAKLREKHNWAIEKTKAR